MKVSELTPTERQFVESCWLGQPTAWVPKKFQSVQATPADNTIRAEVIVSLIIGDLDGKMPTYKGIHLEGAEINGRIDISYLDIGFPLTFRLCEFDDLLIAQGAELAHLDLTGSFLKKGIFAEGVDVKRNVLFGMLPIRKLIYTARYGQVLFQSTVVPFASKEKIILRQARVGGQLFCDGANLFPEIGEALLAENMTVGTSVFMGRDFRAQGSVNLGGSTIGKQVSCGGGRFSLGSDEQPDGCPALNLDSVKVSGAVNLDKGFVSHGNVRLSGAEIGRLECDGGQFLRAGGRALCVESARIKGNAFLRHIVVEGLTSFHGTEIEGRLDCDGARFISEDNQPAFVGQEIKVGRSLVWKNITSSGYLCFQNAVVGPLLDDLESWSAGCVMLDGFVYSSFPDAAPSGAKERLNWLSRQKDFSAFLPQPYEQLIRVMRAMGHEEGARKVAIAKQDALVASRNLTILQKLWKHVLWATAGYGYRPARALVIAAAVVALGAAMSLFFYQYGHISPTKEWAYIAGSVDHTSNLSFAECVSHYDGVPTNCIPPDYPRFTPLAYSLDVFLPIVSLHQEEFWLPNTKAPVGWIMWIWLWLEQGSGWFLTSLLVAALSGVIKKD